MLLNKASRLCLSTLVKGQSIAPVLSKYAPVVTGKLTYCTTSSIEKKGPEETVTDTSHAMTPQHHLSSLDRATLKVFGNQKGEIPDEVSYATMEKADSKRRIAINIFLMVFTAVGAMIIVYTVKKNLKNHTQENVYVQNSQRYKKDKE